MDKLLAIAPSSPRPRRSTVRPRVRVQFPAQAVRPEGSEPARCFSLRLETSTGRGAAAISSARGPRHSRREAAPHAASPPASRTITDRRRARPGTSAAAGPPGAHAQCGPEPRPRRRVRVAACSPAPRGTQGRDGGREGAAAERTVSLETDRGILSFFEALRAPALRRPETRSPRLPPGSTPLQLLL